MNTPKDHEKP